MKTLKDYLSESETWMHNPAEGDAFGIELSDGTLVESYILELADDSILLDATADIVAVLESWNLLSDQESEEGVILETMSYGTLVGDSMAEATGDPKFDNWLNDITSKKQVAKQSKGIEDIISAIEQELADPGQHIDILYDVLNATRDLSTPTLDQVRPWILRYAKQVTTGKVVDDDWSIDLGRPLTPYEIVTAYNLDDLLAHSFNRLEKDVKSAKGNLNELAPGGENKNGPLQYGMAIIEIGKEYSTLRDDEAAVEDGEMIEEVGQTFLHKGMTAGIAALFDLDTQVSDDVLHYLDEEGFDTQKDIITPYRTPIKQPQPIENARKRQEATFYNITINGKPINPKPIFGRRATIAWGEKQQALGVDLSNAKVSPIKEGMTEEETDEAKYHGREVPLGKPMAGDVKKSKVYVKDPVTGNIKKVNFGDPNMRIKKTSPAHRKSFRARHHCENPGPRTKARFWSCRAW